MKKIAPLILAVVLLLLPVLYVGSYFALVTPGTGTPVLVIRRDAGPGFAYADQSEQDHEILCQAVRQGKLEVFIEGE
jgi:hypothetical protein